jgi:hypothetical protein
MKAKTMTPHVAALATLLVPLTMRGAPMRINNNGLDVFGVRLIDSSDPDFQGRSPKNADTLGTQLTYALVLVNDSKRPVASATVQYNVDGVTHTMTLNTTESDTSKMLQPGEGKLFAPDFPAAQAINHGGVGLLPKSTDDRVGPYLRASKITATLDSLVWGDTGEMIGPDTNGTLAALQAEQHAKASMAALIKGNQGDALVSALTAIANARPPDAGKDYYNFQLWTQAQGYLNAFKMKGPSGGEALIRQDLAQWDRPQLNLWRKP